MNRSAICFNLRFHQGMLYKFPEFNETVWLRLIVNIKNNKFTAITFINVTSCPSYLFDELKAAFSEGKLDSVTFNGSFVGSTQFSECLESLHNLKRLSFENYAFLGSEYDCKIMNAIAQNTVGLNGLEHLVFNNIEINSSYFSIICEKLVTSENLKTILFKQTTIPNSEICLQLKMALGANKQIAVYYSNSSELEMAMNGFLTQSNPVSQYSFFTPLDFDLQDELPEPPSRCAGCLIL